MQDYHILWETAGGSDAKEDTQSLLETVQREVEQQTDEQVKIGEVHELEPATGAIISYIIGVGSALTAQAIVSVIKDHERTIAIEIDTEAEFSQNEIETETDSIELSISVDSEDE